VGTVLQAGAVNVLYGSPGGLTGDGDDLWTQDSPGIVGTAEPEDLFGDEVIVANFGNGAQADLAVGSRGEDIGNVQDAGAVTVIYGSVGGLTSSGNQLWTQDSNGIIGTSESGDFFGAELAAGNFGGSSQADLAVGVEG